MSANNILRAITLLLISLCIFLPATSCSNSTGETIQTETVQTDTAETAPLTGIGYDYPITDLNGATVTFLNADQMWQMNMVIMLEEDDGSDAALYDAVNNRNIKIMELYNCVINEVRVNCNGNLVEVAKETEKAVLSGDDTYDAAYLAIGQSSYFLSNDYLWNLNEIDELNLDSEWWDQTVIAKAEIGGKLYCATSAAHLMPYESSWCVYFNADMMTDYSLEYPYDLVRNGTWTIDKMYEYMQAVAAPNGDGKYKWEPDGTSIYGVEVHDQSVEKFILSCGQSYISTDSNGYPVFSANTESFFNAVDKISKLYNGDEGTLHHGSMDSENFKVGGFISIFENSRSLLITSEVATSSVLRDMEDSFGILPFPKYDEAQENYYASMARFVLMFTIPITNADPSNTAIVFDALSYESNVNVIPVYYEVTVKQKQLRDENSIEMLGIIRQGRTLDVGFMFGLVENLSNNVSAMVESGKSEIASTIAKQEIKINEKIDSLMG